MSLLHYYQGSMYAGKSTHAVNALLAGKNYQHKIIISPSWHARGFLSRNHKEQELPAEVLILPDWQALNIQEHLSKASTLLVVDEVQFYPEEALADLLERAKASKDLDLIVAGLQVGQHGMPFHNHDLLMSYFAQKVTKLYAPCAICNHEEGLVAVRKWLINDHIKDEYSLMCKECFEKFFAYGRGSITIPDPLFEDQ